MPNNFKLKTCNFRVLNHNSVIDNKINSYIKLDSHKFFVIWTAYFLNRLKSQEI